MNISRPALLQRDTGPTQCRNKCWERTFLQKLRKVLWLGSGAKTTWVKLKHHKHIYGYAEFKIKNRPQVSLKTSRCVTLTNVETVSSVTPLQSVNEFYGFVTLSIS